MAKLECERRLRQLAKIVRKKEKRERKYLNVSYKADWINDFCQNDDGTVNKSYQEQCLKSLVIETAYDGYARGTGDILGPATATYDSRSQTYNLRYVLSTQAATSDCSHLALTNWTTENTWITITNGSDYVRATGDTAIFADWATNEDWAALSWRNQGTPAWNGAVLYDETKAVNPLAFEKLQIINKKAEELLLQHLTDGQRKTWLADKYFDVLVPSGRRYRLTKGLYHNVFLLDLNGKRVREYCAYSRDPGGSLPVEDNLFAQMMTLMFDEQEFLAKANTWNLLEGRKFAGQGVDAVTPEPLVAAA